MSERENLTKLQRLSPLLLLADIMLAGALWYFRAYIFPESLMWLAAPLAVALMLASLAGYFFLQSITHKTR